MSYLLKYYFYTYRPSIDSSFQYENVMIVHMKENSPPLLKEMSLHHHFQFWCATSFNYGIFTLFIVYKWHLQSSSSIISPDADDSK